MKTTSLRGFLSRVANREQAGLTPAKSRTGLRILSRERMVKSPLIGSERRPDARGASRLDPVMGAMTDDRRQALLANYMMSANGDGKPVR